MAIAATKQDLWNRFADLSLPSSLLEGKRLLEIQKLGKQMHDLNYEEFTSHLEAGYMALANLNHLIVRLDMDETRPDGPFSTKEIHSLCFDLNSACSSDLMGRIWAAYKEATGQSISTNHDGTEETIIDDPGKLGEIIERVSHHFQRVYDAIHPDETEPLSASSPYFSKINQIAQISHKHPLALRLPVIVIGIALLGLSPLVGVTTGGMIALASTGMGLVGVGVYIWRQMDTYLPGAHEMKDHLFEEKSYGSSRLYYHGDVPILELNESDDEGQGRAYGYLAAPQIAAVTEKFRPRIEQNRPLFSDDSFMKTFMPQIPESLLKEMSGLINGYNQWRGEQTNPPQELTFEDLLLFQMVPDFGKFLHSRNLIQGVGCTALATHDEERGPTLARAMDWQSLGVAGSHSLIIHRKREDRYDTVDVTIPGLIGTLTGMNEQGLTLMQNVVHLHQNEYIGLPSMLYNRLCLETCANMQEVDAFVDKKTPLSPYHLTAADKESAKSYHLLQGTRGRIIDSAKYPHVARPLDKHKPLSTFNCRYSPYPSHPIHFDRERQEAIEQFHTEGRELEEALALPYINNFLSTHKVVMQPQERKMQVAFDNAFAGSHPLQTVPTDQMFS